MRHRGLGQPHLGFRQRERPAALASARPRGREPGQGAFADPGEPCLAERGHQARAPLLLAAERGPLPVRPQLP